MDKKYVIGVDFGSDSVRAVVVDGLTGEIISSSTVSYRRWAEGKYCEPEKNKFRQHPLDYIESLEKVIKTSLAKTNKETAAKIAAISIDTTCSTPCFVDKKGIPLSLKKGFEEDPDAMFILWKDHTSIEEAKEINCHAKKCKDDDYTSYEGGVYSSEWFWAKALHIIRSNPDIIDEAATILEHTDWMPALLTGVTDYKNIKRARGAAGHKAMWHPKWGGFPPEKFFSKLHPKLAAIRKTLPVETYTADRSVGRLCPEWADKLGLSTDIQVTAGMMDAQSGAVGGGIKPGSLLKIMGTSTCDLAIDYPENENDVPVPGICGQVIGSAVPGMICYEAGQSAYGDIFAWFTNFLLWPFKTAPGLKNIEFSKETLFAELEKGAALLAPDPAAIVSLDWFNGRRTPYADQSLKAAISGLTLSSDAPAVYRSLIEAAAFGSKRIIEQLQSEGVTINRLIAAGGVSRKSPLIMQINADILGMEIGISEAEESCALGAAICATAAAGFYKSVEDAQETLGAGEERTYYPDAEKSKVYEDLYQKYLQLGKYMEGRL